MSRTARLPSGFTHHFRQSRFTDPWEPLYSRILEDRIQLALIADEAHCNSRGFVHGGLITALADNAMGLSCAHQLDDIGGLVTVSLSTDFIDSGQIKDLLLFDTEVLKTGGRLCFAQCLVLAGDKPISRANASFQIIRKKDHRRTAV
ncbi:PaaI family thioesterase [Sneathiella aquimaris]|uniref:PaaI family thioesterase n=1 Tax=Sneathiella aquimaris TaxID=2599305 RepID=UPI00146B4B1E|nr:PaaI family thioesterase [Sneathiella aquimaris]